MLETDNEVLLFNLGVTVAGGQARWEKDGDGRLVAQAIKLKANELEALASVNVSEVNNE